MRFAVLLLAVTVVGGPLLTPRALADSNELHALRWRVFKFCEGGEYDQAAPIAERYVEAARKRHGEKHLEFADALSWSGRVREGLGHYGEAEPLYKRSLEIREKALGRDHLLVAASLSKLAELYTSQGRYTEAEPLYKRKLQISEKMSSSYQRKGP